MVSPAVTTIAAPLETGDSTEVSVAHRACAVTVKVPGPGQE
jgi:hypothetical protein